MEQEKLFNRNNVLIEAMIGWSVYMIDRSYDDDLIRFKMLFNMLNEYLELRKKYIVIIPSQNVRKGHN